MEGAAALRDELWQRMLLHKLPLMLSRVVTARKVEHLV